MRSLIPALSLRHHCPLPTTFSQHEDDVMRRYRRIGLIAAVATAASLLSTGAMSQEKSLRELLIGSWYLVTQIQERPDGRKEEFYGQNPKGINIFSADGRFAVIFTRSDLPKLSGGDRRTATPDEARAILMGTIAYFGTYEVDEARRTIRYKSEGTTFPNQGPTATRLITVLNADELRYRNPKVTSGGQLEVVLRRAK
jgi:hypothetical protein